MAEDTDIWLLQVGYNMPVLGQTAMWVLDLPLEALSALVSLIEVSVHDHLFTSGVFLAACEINGLVVAAS